MKKICGMILLLLLVVVFNDATAKDRKRQSSDTQLLEALEVRGCVVGFTQTSIRCRGKQDICLVLDFASNTFTVVCSKVDLPGPLHGHVPFSTYSIVEDGDDTWFAWED